MKTLYRGAEGGIIILNAAVAAADGAVARANDLINNSPLNSLVNGVLRRSCTVACKHHVWFPWHCDVTRYLHRLLTYVTYVLELHGTLDRIATNTL